MPADPTVAATLAPRHHVQGSGFGCLPLTRVAERSDERETIARDGGCQGRSWCTGDSEAVAKPGRQPIIWGTIREAHQEGTSTA